MKKLIISAAIAIVAVASNAATVKWNATSLTDGTGAAVAAAGKITGYLWKLTAADYATYAAMDAATLSKTVGAAFKANTLGTSEATAANTYSSRAGSALSLQGTSTFNAGDTAYGLILYVDAASDKYLANVASLTFASAQNGIVSDLANTLGGTGSTAGATSWQAVPEPTSGLLMLLGMAGLALRRKRA